MDDNDDRGWPITIAPLEPLAQVSEKNNKNLCTFRTFWTEKEEVILFLNTIITVVSKTTQSSH